MSDWRQKLSGRFVVVDGPDGAGKGTQIRLLAEFLASQGVELCLARDPGGTAVGERIRSILLDKAHDGMSVQCELMLYMASRAQLAGEVLRPALAAGKCVLCDRYISSTVAYQGAGGVDPADVKAVAEVAVGGLWPDLTVILDIASDAGLARVGASRRTGGPDRMESKTAAFHRKVRELFLKQAADEPDRFAVVDAAGTMDEVQQRLRRAIHSWRFKDSRA